MEYLKNTSLGKLVYPFKQMAIAGVLLCCTGVFPFPPNHQFPDRNHLIFFLITEAVKWHPVTLKFPLACRYFPVRNTIMAPSTSHLTVFFRCINGDNSSNQWGVVYIYGVLNVKPLVLPVPSSKRWRLLFKISPFHARTWPRQSSTGLNNIPCELFLRNELTRMRHWYQ